MAFLLDVLRRCAIGLGVAALLAGCSQVPGQHQGGVQRLYVLDCGEARIPDVSPWSPGVNVGVAAVFSDNCYLIRHGQDWMLWDSGYADSLADTPEGVVGNRGARALRTRTLVSQLAELGVAPAQIKHLAFSHSHADHVGNANLFSAATLYIQQAEYDAAFGAEASKFGFQPANYEKLRGSTMVKLNGDHDVFSDGSVKILSTPGHTPGHQSLLVRLPKTGVVVLSGDLAHFGANFASRRVPGFNFNADESRRSMDKIDALVQAERGHLWINHDVKQSASLVHAPQYFE